MTPTLAQSPELSRLVVDWTVHLGLVVTVAGLFLCVLRIFRGPTFADRAVAADTMSHLLIGIIVLLAIEFRSLLLFEGVVILSLLAFAGTVAMGQFVARHSRGEADRNP